MDAAKNKFFTMKVTPTNWGGVTQEQFLSKLPTGTLIEGLDDMGTDRITLSVPKTTKSKESGRALESAINNLPLRAKVKKGDSLATTTYVIKKKHFANGGLKAKLDMLAEKGVTYTRKGGTVYIQVPEGVKAPYFKLQKHAVGQVRVSEQKIAEKALGKVGAIRPSATLLNPDDVTNILKIKEEGYSPKRKIKRYVEKAMQKRRTEAEKRLISSKQCDLWGHSSKSNPVQKSIGQYSGGDYSSLEEFASKNKAYLKRDTLLRGFPKWDEPLAKIRDNIAKGYSENAGIRFFQKAIRLVH